MTIGVNHRNVNNNTKASIVTHEDCGALGRTPIEMGHKVRKKQEEVPEPFYNYNNNKIIICFYFRHMIHE